MIWVALAFFAALAAAPFVIEELRTPVSRVYRTGEVAALPGGATHYQWTGPETGPVAVCVHGLTTPSFVFSGVTRSLAALGYRVLTYDLYGRGFSDRPGGWQTPEFFLRQLRALLDDQGVQGRFTLVGYSMGGAIATALAAEESRRLHALILLAPAGIEPIYDSPLDHVWTAPLLGDWLVRAFGGRALRRELSREPALPTMIPDLRARQIAETRKRGFLPAVLSSRRHTLSRLYHDEHALIRKTGTPVLAIWARDDPVIPLRAMATLAQLNPDAHHVEIADAGHDFPQTHPAQVAEALRGFLKPD